MNTRAKSLSAADRKLDTELWSRPSEAINPPESADPSIGSGDDQNMDGMYKVLLADSQAIFRAGAAKVLAMEDDFRILAQCAEVDRLFHAISTFPNAVVMVAASLNLHYECLRDLLKANNSRCIIIAEGHEKPSTFLDHGFHGVIYRNITGPGLVECARTVARGGVWRPEANTGSDQPDEDMVGTRVRDRLTPKEMKIVALIVQGCKNREIAEKLHTTEQVIKNYLRSIYDKTGVGDRLELALFTIHHHVLAKAAAEVGQLLEVEAS
jgi:DNA-binding NarL/FixJ family response regulator